MSFEGEEDILYNPPSETPTERAKAETESRPLLDAQIGEIEAQRQADNASRSQGQRSKRRGRGRGSGQGQQRPWPWQYRRRSIGLPV